MRPRKTNRTTTGPERDGGKSDFAARLSGTDCLELLQVLLVWKANTKQYYVHPYKHARARCINGVVRFQGWFSARRGVTDLWTCRVRSTPKAKSITFARWPDRTVDLYLYCGCCAESHTVLSLRGCTVPCGGHRFLPRLKTVDPQSKQSCLAVRVDTSGFPLPTIRP